MSETIMFDFPAFYERISRELPDNCKVCEVGVANADSALYLCSELHRIGKKFKMYMVDSMGYGQYIQMKTIYENIIKSGLGEYIEVVPYPSVEASKMSNDGSLDFCFIDASHEYQATKDDIKSWWPKVIDGGILAGHDFFYHEVKWAVEELIPYFMTREPINEQVFEAEEFLHVEGTDRGYGVFWAIKDWYKQLNL